MFYELRIYHPAPGRLGDLVERTRYGAFDLGRARPASAMTFNQEQK